MSGGHRPHCNGHHFSPGRGLTFFVLYSRVWKLKCSREGLRICSEEQRYESTDKLTAHAEMVSTALRDRGESKCHYWKSRRICGQTYIQIHWAEPVYPHTEGKETFSPPCRIPWSYRLERTASHPHAHRRRRHSSPRCGPKFTQCVAMLPGVILAATATGQAATATVESARQRCSSALATRTLSSQPMTSTEQFILALLCCLTGWAIMCTTVAACALKRLSKAPMKYIKEFCQYWEDKEVCRVSRETQTEMPELYWEWPYEDLEAECDRQGIYRRNTSYPSRTGGPTRRTMVRALVLGSSHRDRIW